MVDLRLVMQVLLATTLERLFARFKVQVGRSAKPRLMIEYPRSTVAAHKVLERLHSQRLTSNKDFERYPRIMLGRQATRTRGYPTKCVACHLVNARRSWYWRRLASNTSLKANAHFSYPPLSSPPRPSSARSSATPVRLTLRLALLYTDL